jgi:hypothetical protein
MRDRVRERVKKDASKSGHHRRVAESCVSDAKLAMILRITDDLTRYYGMFEYWEEWAYGMTHRESLGTTGADRVAIPHDYQFCGEYPLAKTINTVNAWVDWWLVLVPGGTRAWDAMDEQPVHVMVTHVLSRPHWESLNEYMRRMILVERVQYDLPFVVELATMDRVSAARLMSRHVVSRVPVCEQSA